MNDVIIACDFENAEQLYDFLDLFKEEKPYLKIGMELFYAEGPSIVKEVKRRGHKVFLDLKLCDIPNTVYKAMKNIAKLEVDMTNVHAFGTVEMMKAAKQGLIDGSVNKTPLLIAVTQLTSTSQKQMNEELWITRSLEEVVQHYAKLTEDASLDGVVCSALEVKAIYDCCNSKFITVTPGIRPAASDVQDQKRVVTPRDAKRLGSTYIVVGRPITNAKNPVESYREMMKEFRGI